MNRDLLERLAQAQTEAERSWIVTESLLEKLSSSLSAAVWAVAVPHWFDAEILAALLPNLQDQAEGLYVDLQALSFVEVFPDRGHNIHERTRNLLLDRLWQDNPEQFQTFSARAAAYFAQDPTRPAWQIEWLYHLAAVDANREGDELQSVAQTWTNAFRRAELESLIKALLEQVESNRAATPVKAEVYYWAGRAKSRFYESTEALDRYEQALSLYRDISDRLGEANTLRSIGDVLQFLDRSTEALDQYEQALSFYRDIGDRLGEANTLRSIGDVLQFLKCTAEALGRYEQALGFFRDIGGNQLGEANTLRSIGDVLQFLRRTTEALDRYEQALSLYRDISDRLGEANTLQAIGIMQEDSVKGLATCLEALELYVQIGTKYSQSRNLIFFTAEVQLRLGQRDEAIDSLNRAAALAAEIGYEPLREAAEAKIQSIREASDAE